jgi:hypothetical protein
MADADMLAGVSSAEWLEWLQRMDRKLDGILDKLASLELPPFEAGDTVSGREAILEERVAKIERKLDISATFEPD